jgi:hypothetical protein
LWFGRVGPADLTEQSNCRSGCIKQINMDVVGDRNAARLIAPMGQTPDSGSPIGWRPHDYLRLLQATADVFERVCDDQPKILRLILELIPALIGPSRIFEIINCVGDHDTGEKRVTSRGGLGLKIFERGLNHFVEIELQIFYFRSFVATASSRTRPATFRLPMVFPIEFSGKIGR